MARIDTSSYKTFSEVTDRLDEIVKAVRDKDASLERSLDLFDEAIALGSKAVEMVDRVEFSEEERKQLADETSSEDTTSSEQPASEAEETQNDTASNKEA